MHRPCRKIAICAPATPLRRDQARAVEDLAQAEFPELTLAFHEQCFAEEGHFAGTDAMRLAALLECARDPGIDAVWFARGGYGSNRIAEDAIAALDATAADKAFLGYSDTGTLLGALYRAGIGRPIHAPMPADIKRTDGAAAVRRTLAWLSGDDGGREPSLSDVPAAAFNLYTLAMLVGTPLWPDLTGHVVMVEEVCEYEYAIDRLFFHLVPHLRGVAGLRLGEVTDIPVNDRPFGANVEDIARYWCAREGISYLGRAAIGHTSANRIVPFGLEAGQARA